MSSTEFTGERVVPGKVDVNLWNEHFARYAFAADYAVGKRVLDLGCGTGYGCGELTRVAASVCGVDIAETAITSAAADYVDVTFVQASATATGLVAASFDLIVAFEVIEHLKDWKGLLAEARRLLTADGVFLVSTPNRAYYNESRGDSGANPFHEHEFEYEEFRDELLAYFPGVTILMQDRVEAFIFQPVKAFPPPKVRVDSSGSPAAAHFFVAICSASVQSRSFVYVPVAANLLRERGRHIEKLRVEIGLKEEWLEQSKSTCSALEKFGESLQGDLEQRTIWARALETELAEARESILDLQRELSKEQAAGRQLATDYESKIADLEQDNRDKTAWAQETEQRLGDELQAKLKELAEAVRLLDQAEATVEERSRWALQLQAQLEMIRASKWVKLGRMVGVGPVA